MIKFLFFLVTLLLLIGCTNPEGEIVVKDLPKVDSAHKESFTLEGLWVMTDFVDSILTYKTISKYSLQGPSMFAILIDIDMDTLKSYGSIIDNTLPYNRENDTLQVFERSVKGNWTLTLNKQTQKLEMRNTDSGSKKFDHKVYVYEKRQDLRFLLDTLNKVHKTRTSMTNYFHDQLFAGNYEIIGSGDQVTFGPNGYIQGLQDFHKYNVDVYYGTSHPYENLDNIIFYRDLPTNTTKFDWELYKWEFKGDTLFLTKFSWKEFNIQGTQVRDEIWSLSDQEIKLKKR